MTAMSKAMPFDYATARLHMVESQLRPNQVTDSRILAAMADIPRELFVPFTLVGIAYADQNVPLISGRHLIQPMVLARMIQALAIKPTDRVLELAPATGYSTVVLSALATKVFSIEPDALLHKEAEKNATMFCNGKAIVLAGAPAEGCGAFAPFDVIFINGCVDIVPEILFNQLAEGGRLVVVVRRHDPAGIVQTGQTLLYTKLKDNVSHVTLFDANVPVVPGFIVSHGFVF